MPADNNVVMESVHLIYRNFSGRKSQFNRDGVPEFSVLLDDEVANVLATDGWNVKWLKPRDEEEEAEDKPQAFLPVAVKFDSFKPPRVVLITSRGRSNLDERSVEMLDWADILNVDLIVRPYPWDVNGKTGIKAYLQSMYVTIEEDPLEQKYAELDHA